MFGGGHASLLVSERDQRKRKVSELDGLEGEEDEEAKDEDQASENGDSRIPASLEEDQPQHLVRLIPEQHFTQAQRARRRWAACRR